MTAGSSHSLTLMKAESRSDGALSWRFLVRASIVGCRCSLPHRHSSMDRMSRSAARCEHPAEIPSLLPVHGYPGPIAAGRWGCFHEYRSTRDTATGAADVPPPSPSAPPPRGRFSIDTVSGGDPLSAVSVNTLLKSCLCPRALYPDYRHALPAPSEGGGRRRGTRRAVGVVYLTRKKSVWLRHRRQGRRMFHPPPRRPLPQGGDIPSIQCPGESTPSPGSR